MKYLRRELPRAFVCCLVFGLGASFAVAQSIGRKVQSRTESNLAATEFYWNSFAVTPTTGSDAGISSVVFSTPAGNNNGTTTMITIASKSSGYIGASSDENFGAAVKLGTLDPAVSTYFEVTITPSSGRIAAVSSIGLGSRSTPTGPKKITLRSSVDNFASDIASFSVSNNSAWAYHTSDLGIAADADTPIVLRIYGSDGTGSPAANTANWRIDDVSLFATGLLAPTAADAVVKGQVVDRFGGGISGAMVTLISPRGERRTVITSSFGYFRFSAVETGETYVLTASSKRHRFQPRSVTVADSIDDLQILALP